MNEPKEDADEQVKDEFYPRLQGGVTNSRDMIIVTGDMNAKVEYENRDYESHGKTRSGPAKHATTTEKTFVKRAICMS